MNDGTIFGNATIDGATTRGWFIGQFINGSLGLRHSEDIEVKWSTHPAGQSRDGVAPGAPHITLGVLVRGKFVVILNEGERVLEHEGDYVLLAPGTPHSWRAEEESVMLTVRWPSV